MEPSRCKGAAAAFVRGEGAVGVDLILEPAQEGVVRRPDVDVAAGGRGQAAEPRALSSLCFVHLAARVPRLGCYRLDRITPVTRLSGLAQPTINGRQVDVHELVSDVLTKHSRVS